MKLKNHIDWVKNKSDILNSYQRSIHHHRIATVDRAPSSVTNQNPDHQAPSSNSPLTL